MTDAHPRNFPHDSQPVDLYLDGLMTDSQRAEFEARLSGDPVLRAEVERQRRVDESLADVFRAPDDRRVAEILERAVRIPDRAFSNRPVRARRWMRPFAAAAAIALLAVAGWRMADALRVNPDVVQKPVNQPQYNPKIAFDVLYKNALAAGFVPRWVCDDDAEFVDTFVKRLRQGLRFVPVEGVAMVGLDYANTLSEFSITFLGTVGREKVLVTVDRLSLDAGYSVPPESGLRTFRRVIDKLVLYEITPLDQPRLLDRFEKVEPATPSSSGPDR